MTQRGVATVISLSLSVGVVVAMLSGWVMFTQLSAQRSAKIQIQKTRGGGVEQRLLNQIHVRLMERLSDSVPITLEELELKLLPAWRGEITADGKSDRLEVLSEALKVEDELGKLSLTSLPYALPFVMKHVWYRGLDYPPADEIRELGEALHLLPGTTLPDPAAPLGVTYWWRPDALMVPMIQSQEDLPETIPALDLTLEPTDRRIAWGVSAGLRIQTALEDVEELVTLWPHRNLEELRPYCTAVPARGLNINTVPNPDGRGYHALQGVMDWQAGVSKFHPDLHGMFYAERKDADGHHDWSALELPKSPYLVVPDPNHPAAAQRPKSFTYPRFRNDFPFQNQAKSAIVFTPASPGLGRWIPTPSEPLGGVMKPYRSKDLVQELAVWPVFWPLSEDFGLTNPSFHFSTTFRIHGPGPYVERSDTYTYKWGANLEGFTYQGWILVKATFGGSPAILRREVIY